jgi:DNA modification methylase
MRLETSKVQQDNKLTPRIGIDETTVGVYAACFEQMPPVDVFWIEGRDGWWLVDGWHRLAAARKLGLAEVEANEHQGTFDDALEFAYDANLKHGRPLTLAQRKEAAKLKLRRHTERSNSWIAGDSGSEIHTLMELTGRDGKTYPRTIEQPKEPEPEPVESVKIYKGDMLDVLPALEQKFDLVIADPPYGVTDYEWDTLDTKNWLEAIIPWLKGEFHLFWFCSPQFATDVELAFRELGLEIQSRIVWHRRNMAKGSHAKNRFIDTWDMIFHVGNKPLNFPSGWTDAWFDVQIHAAPQSNFSDKKLHPTQKPYSLIRRLVEFGSAQSDMILDPFAGAGTTGAACQEDDRQCVLIELEEGYCGIIEGRLGITRGAVEWQELHE